MTKFLKFICGAFLLNQSVYAQAKIDTVKMEGYVVEEFWESSIKAYQKTLKEKVKGNVSSIAMDDQTKYSFYPILRNELLKAAMDANPENKNNIYLSYNTSQLWLRKTFIDKLNIQKSAECALCDNSPFLKIQGEKKKLYKAYYVKGVWLKIQMDSTDSDFTKLRKRVDSIAIKDNEKYTLFIMINCGEVSRYIDHKPDRDIELTNYVD